MSMQRMMVAVVQRHDNAGLASINTILEDEPECVVSNFGTVPDNLDCYHVLVLNNIALSDINTTAARLTEYITGGGGCFAIHDSTFPWPGFEVFLEALGLQLAFDGIGLERQLDNSMRMDFHLARSDPDRAEPSFPVRPDTRQPIHPIIRNVKAFDIRDEFWPNNISTDVRPLLWVDVGDRLPDIVERLRRPTAVAGCRNLQGGRCVFLTIGHYPQTYSDPAVAQVIKNAILWAGKRIHASSYLYDLFISFFSENNQRASRVANKAEALGIRHFLSKKAFEGGDLWDEEIRRALLSSREMCVLTTEKAMASEWVTTEWGSAWVLERRITPILIKGSPRKLPERLRRMQAIRYANVDDYLKQVARRSSEDVV